MAKMTAVDAAVHVLRKEGVNTAFGVPGAAINPLLRGAARARGHQPPAGAPRRGRVAHGRGLHPRRGGQHRRVHRHLGPGRHRHDHRPVFGRRRLDPDPVHHRPGAARTPAQGRLPGRRHRRHRQAGDQDGHHRDGTGAGAARVPAGLPPDALGPAGPGARSTCRSTCRWPRSNSTPTPTSRCRSTSPAPRAAGGEGAGHADGCRTAADRRRRRHHQCRRRGAAGASSPSSPACR